MQLIMLEITFVFQDQMPTFVTSYDQIKAKGVDSVNCLSVNDPFVMEAFGKALNAEGKVRMQKTRLYCNRQGKTAKGK